MLPEDMRYKFYVMRRGFQDEKFSRLFVIDNFVRLLDNLVGRLKDGGVAQGEPPGGVGEGGLASQLT
jgi:hypothetical protein